MMVHCWEFIPKALFIYLTEVQFLYSVSIKMLFIKQGLLCFKKYNKLLKFLFLRQLWICFSKWWISKFRVKLFCLTLKTWLMSWFYYQYLEYSPLANVAHNISPVPVLNCELLNGPEPLREEVLSVHGSFSEPPVLSFHWKMRVTP